MPEMEINESNLNQISLVRVGVPTFGKKESRGPPRID